MSARTSARTSTSLRSPLAVLPLLVVSLLACGGEDPAARMPTPAGNTAGGRTAHATQHYGEDLDHAVEIAPGIFQARATGNAHAIVTPAGRVIYDTGLPTQSERQRELLDAADDGPITHVIVSHAHMDHTGGAADFMDEGAELIAHRDFLEVQEYLTELVPYFMERNRMFYPDRVPNVPGRLLRAMYPTFEPTILVDDEYVFEVGGQRFEVIHTPGAEGSDSICLWLPDRKILFAGDFFGPIFPMFPNLTTLRGERFRFARPYIRSLDRVIALEPEMIVPSHFEPIEGWEENIRPALVKMRDAVAYVHDAVVEGMNDGKDVYTLMNEIELPPHLQVSQAHGALPWTIRGIWEGYSGWFHFRSTTELYPVPPSSVDGDLVELAGGAGALAERAEQRIAAGQPVEALHLTDIALGAEPASQPALRARLRALSSLLEASGGTNHHEVMWLEAKIAETSEQLGEG